MRHLLSFLMVNVVLVAALHAQPQSRYDQWETVSKVEIFRRVWLEQTDSIDVCSLSDADGFVDVPGGSVSDGASSMLLRWRSRTCGPQSGPAQSRTVSLTALSVDADEARIELTVSRGERAHREVFLLRRHPSPIGRTVIEMRIVGLLRRTLPGNSPFPSAP